MPKAQPKPTEGMATPPCSSTFSAIAKTPERERERDEKRGDESER